jgi:3',5'-cyclic-AMP phosphodiesterase
MLKCKKEGINMSFSLFVSKAAAFLMALFITMIPYNGEKLPVLQTEEADCQLNMALISDIHLEANGIFRTGFLKCGLKNMSKAKSPIDAIVINGDLTNYGDEESLATYYDIIKNYAPKNSTVVTVAGNHDIGHVGDRDITDITREEALANIIKYHNEYYGDNSESNYYSLMVNGYKIIVLGDEVVDGGHWDAVSMTQAQLDFLDKELSEGTSNGLPVFVCCHWPFYDVNGSEMIYDGSNIQPEDFEYQIKSIMEKYKNVFYISGHIHGGVRCTEVGEKYDMPMAEKVNGVTYLSLPTFGIVNWYGLTWSGTGAQLEVYKDKVLFRPVNYLTDNWYENSEYTFYLD